MRHPQILLQLIIETTVRINEDPRNFFSQNLLSPLQLEAAGGILVAIRSKQCCRAMMFENFARFVFFCYVLFQSGRQRHTERSCCVRSFGHYLFWGRSWLQGTRFSLYGCANDIFRALTTRLRFLLASLHLTGNERRYTSSSNQTCQSIHSFAKPPQYP